MEARHTEPGKFYRRTRKQSRGSYWTRPSSVTLPMLVKKLSKKGRSLTGREWSILRANARDPGAVLLKRHHRGCDPFTKKRWEYSQYQVVPADFKLREVQGKPSYQ